MGRPTAVAASAASEAAASVASAATCGNAFPFRPGGVRLIILHPWGILRYCGGGTRRCLRDRISIIVLLCRDVSHVPVVFVVKAQSVLIDGEVVITSDNGMLDFRVLQSKRRGHEALRWVTALKVW